VLLVAIKEARQKAESAGRSAVVRLCFTVNPEAQVAAAMAGKRLPRPDSLPRVQRYGLRWFG
jgi:hypothetical protein